MAIEAQLNSENLGFSMFGSQGQNLMLENNNNNNNNNGSFGNQQLCFNAQQHNSTLIHSPQNNSYLGYSIAAQEAKQRQEIDDCLRLRNERLRLVLHEQRKQQLALVLKNVECRTGAMMRRKNEQLAQAVSKKIELEGFLRTMEAENHAWPIAAKENEAMVMSLNNTLQQLKERAARAVLAMEEDAESCCGNSRSNRQVFEDDEEEEEEMKMMVCKGCNSERSSVLFLPCRHLCSCKTCEVVFDACPVCSTPKKASIDALIF